jgi:biopolymer transport protein ExbD
MRMRRHSSQVGESNAIDLAPMLDFVLNLLIFFIITAVFVKELGLSVNRPSGEQQTQQTEGSGSIPISITATGEIYVDNRVVDIRAVRPNVERLFAVNPKAGVLIMTDKDAETGVLTQVVDQVHMGGIYNITFSTLN